MRRAGRSEIASKKNGQQTLDQLIEAFNQAAYKAIEAHSGENMPNTPAEIRRAHTELDKISQLHEAVTDPLSPKDHQKFLDETKDARGKITELFTQININQRALQSKSNSTTNSPHLQSERHEKSTKVAAARQANEDFATLLKAADQIASGKVSPPDMKNLEAKFNDFKASPSYQQLEQQDRKYIEQEFAKKVQEVNQKRANIDSSPVIPQKTVKVESKTSATQEEGNRLSFALSAKYDDLLTRANKIDLKGGTETEKQQLRSEYQQFIARDDFQALKGSIKNGFIKSMEKILPPMSQAVSAPESQRVKIGTNRQKSASNSTIQEAKEQFVQSFENAVEQLSNPRQEAAATQKESVSAQAQTDNKSSARDSKLNSPPPKRPPPVFQKVMQERADKLNSQKEHVTPTRTSRSGSFKGA